jgi:peroxiredoxin
MKRPGEKAPSFSLTDLNGATVSATDLMKRGKAVFTLFKISCPTCQYTLPFLERLHRALPDAQIVGISQDSPADTKAFAKQFGITFPILVDNDGYKVSRAFGITTVPSIFVVDGDQTISSVSEGWVKDEFDSLANSVAAPAPPPIVFKAGESVQQFKAG